MERPKSILKKYLKIYLFNTGILVLIVILWTLFNFPILIDRICIRSEAPTDAEYIVCVGAGFITGNLPTDDGWGRIYTSVQLYLDGFGRKIIFTGGGSSRVSEAEVYAEAARWLGLGENDAVLDPGPNQTSEHPKNILALRDAAIDRGTALNIVTSGLHSKRTVLCFKKAGFTNFRLVTNYTATGKRVAEGKVVSRSNAEPFLRAKKTSQLPAFKQSDKVYDDIFTRLKWRSAYFFTTLRELSAMLIYKLKGYI